MTCYRDGGCGPYEQLSCNECPYSHPPKAADVQAFPKAQIDKINICKLAVTLWGVHNQCIKAIEEFSELMKALCKIYFTGFKAEENVREEIADCKIMLTQLEIIFGSVDDWEQKKLSRLEGIINDQLKDGKSNA
jgi:hypothetical protein